MATRFDVTMQWTDETREIGHRECLEDLVIEACDETDAIAQARAIRPWVTSVQVQGIHGTAIAFDGSCHRWDRDAE